MKIQRHLQAITGIFLGLIGAALSVIGVGDLLEGYTLLNIYVVAIGLLLMFIGFRIFPSID